ncbi:efflux RND transporter periplasmic adaptor subunit [Ferrovibrio sp.]|uniref:efflux RND transporter periplasmic adaptor subunit n=1 Tax=Ferrovibrio sp. TaxID=1917215 RepID=UPI003D123E12
MTRIRRMSAALLLAAAMMTGAALAQVPQGEGDYTVRAQLRSRTFTTLAAAMPGVILRMPVREGDQLAANALVAVMDCAVQQAGKKVVEARLTGAQAKSRVNERLTELNMASVLESELAKAEEAQARAELYAIDVTLRKCEVRAPFAGTVVAQAARAHQFVREGEPLIELYDTASLEVELIVASRWLEWLRPGAAFTITVDELRKPVRAVVDRFGGRVDPVSQTVRLIGRVEGEHRDLLPGMSGLAQFQRAR